MGKRGGVDPRCQTAEAAEAAAALRRRRHWPWLIRVMHTVTAQQIQAVTTHAPQHRVYHPGSKHAVQSVEHRPQDGH